MIKHNNKEEDKEAHKTFLIPCKNFYICEKVKMMCETFFCCFLHNLFFILTYCLRTSVKKFMN